MSYEIEGVIESISDTINVTDRFQKRELILSVADHRGEEQPIKIEFLQASCDLLDAYNEGEQVTVSFDITGRYWKNRQGDDMVFNSLKGWRIYRGDSRRPAAKAAASAAPTTRAKATPSKAAVEEAIIEADDAELPF